MFLDHVNLNTDTDIISTCSDWSYHNSHDSIMIIVHHHCLFIIHCTAKSLCLDKNIPTPFIYHKNGLFDILTSHVLYKAEKILCENEMCSPVEVAPHQQG